jgi:hypothetical protein
MESPISGDIEVDESFFGPRRAKGKRGRGASGKTSSSFDLTMFSYLAWALLSDSIDYLGANNQTCHQVYDSIGDPGEFWGTALLHYIVALIPAIEAFMGVQLRRDIQ